MTKNLYQTGLVEINNPGYLGASMELRSQYHHTQVLPKKDKKKLAIANRLIAMEDGFYEEKNEYYKSSLSKLQLDLTSTHNETNELFVEQLRNRQERRDYELTRLRLWESYQVAKVEKETREDVEKINEEYDTFIKIIKDKLYEKLVRKIKLLKEDKVLKDLANVNHYSIDVDLMNSNDNRSHKPQEAVQQAISPQKKLVSLTDGGATLATNGLLSGFSDNNTNNNYSSNPLGRRSARRTRGPVESSYNTDSNISGNDSSMPGYISSSSNKRRRFQSARAAAASGTSHNTRSYSSASNDEANFFSDNNSLSEILFGKNYSSSGGGNKSSTGHHPSSSKGPSRAKSKQFTGLPGLKPEEVNEDLLIFESELERVTAAQSIFTPEIQNGTTAAKKR